MQFVFGPRLEDAWEARQDRSVKATHATARATWGLRCMIFASGLAIWLVSTSARAAPHRPGKGGDLGFGPLLGDPTGANLLWFITPRHTLSANLGFGPIHLGGGRVDVSYLWQGRPWTSTDELSVRGYVGVGVGVAFWHERYVGPAPSDFVPASFFPRAPVLGIACDFLRIPIDIFVEAAYSPLIGPPLTYWNVDFALGSRYWF